MSVLRDRPLRISADPAFRTRHANPYNALLYGHLARRGVEVEELTVGRLVLDPPDVVHVHWPELRFLSGRRWWRTAWRIGSFTAAMAVARLRRGTRLVWTVHNLVPHEHGSGASARAFWALFSRQVDGVLTLTASALEPARTTYPPLRRAVAAVTPHGDYRGEVDRTLPRTEARAGLGVDPDARVLLFVGQIRPYKDVPGLLDAFARLPDPGARLVVAGQVRDPALRAEVEERAARDPRVRLDLEFQPAPRLSAWLAAADVVVLPYSDVLNSGSALLALSADRPVVVPDRGAMPELRAAVGGAWVHTFDGPLEDALRTALTWGPDADRPPCPDLTPFTWTRVAALTEAALHQVVTTPRRRTLDGRR